MPFKTYAEAEEYVELKFEEFDDLDYLLIMKRGNEYIVTECYRAYHDEGFEKVVSIFR